MRMNKDSAIVVLIAEDDDTLRYLARRQLTALGCTCDVVENGAEALEMAAANKYDLIFMDVQMPIMNGLEATEAIRQHETENNSDKTPIVAMTANPKKQMCYDAGMNGFIFKPISLDMMQDALDRWAA
jgi:CheY-like chemotaxis protein